MHGTFIQPEEYVEKIESVTQSDILKIAKELFKGARVSLALVGPVTDTGEKERYSKLLTI